MDSPISPLLGKMPLLHRARDYRVYDVQGKRYLDMYLNNGRAFLGHKPPRVITDLKNSVSKGLLAEYPSLYRQKLAKALRKLVPEFPHLRLFPSWDKALRILNILPADPALEEPEEGSVSLWRPFLPAPLQCSRLVPLLPFPGSFAPCAVISKEEVFPGDDEEEAVSPLLLSALTRCVYDLLAFAGKFSTERWDAFSCRLFRRRGPYLTALCGPGEYGDLFNHMLSKGIILSPRYPGPSILPAEYSSGEIKPLLQY